MPNNSWKQWERDMCVSLNGSRTGPMGDSLPDCKDTPYLSVECKLTGKLAFRERDIEQARRNARPGTYWAVAYKERRTNKKFVVMDAGEFAELYQYLRELEERL